MRPLRLQVENLASFRGRHEPLDFSSFELFAIAGPTGAGKSSLLDAMVFALYGKVPRLGKSVSEMVALGRDRMAVTFDFTSAGKTYRVVRALNRAKKGRGSEAALEEILPGGEEKPLADGPANVDAALERIVGLGYDAFTQAVVLPQGEFQRFLRSQPRERRAILGDLLRLQVYGRMYDGASEETRRLTGFLQAQQAQIEGETEIATPEAIGAMKAQFRELDASNAALKQRIGELEKALAGLREGRRRTTDLDAALASAAELYARHKQLEQADKQLAAATKAEQLKPRIEAAERAKNDMRGISQRWDNARRAETEATVTAEAAKRALLAVERAAEKLPKLEQRLRDLDTVSGLVVPLSSARGRLAEAMAKQERADRDLEGAKAAEREARARAKDAAKAAKEAKKALDGAEYDPERHRRLEALREPAVILGQLRLALARSRSDAVSLEKDLSNAADAERTATAAAAAAEASQAAADQELRAAEEAQRRVERDHATAHLRAGLQEGQACPVCEQKVTRLPAPIAASALDEVRGRVATTREAARLALGSRERSRQDAAHAAAAHRQLRERAAQLAGQARAAEQAHDEAEARLQAAAKDLPRAKTPIEERLRAALDASAAQHEAHAARAAEHERAGREDERAQQALAKAADDAATIARALEDQERLAEAAKREVRDLEARIGAVTKGADPTAERDRLEGDRARLLGEREQAKRSERETGDALLQAKLEREQMQHAMSDAQRVLGETGTALDTALAAAGFKNAASAAAAALDEAVRVGLQRTVDEVRRETDAVERRVQELQRELAGGRVEAERLRQAEDQLVAGRLDLEDGTAEAAKLSERAAALEERAERAKQLSQGLQRDRRRQAVYQQLTNDLRSENFRAFLLEEAFRELVLGASERLMDLSGRYSFEFENDAFQVIDHDNAGERRSAETLSGGETFLASLALALELSQQIQRAAGAVHLDSLFLDEGFGTLDPESLETIAAALEDLPVGGRMVGIITHIAELTDRLPHRVRVEKRQEGSTFKVETA